MSLRTAALVFGGEAISILVGKGIKTSTYSQKADCFVGPRKVIGVMKSTLRATTWHGGYQTVRWLNNY